LRGSIAQLPGYGGATDVSSWINGEKAMTSKERQNYSSGSKWENIVGYSRAVRIGDRIEVSGTVAVDGSGECVGPHDPYEQTRFILKKIIDFVEQAGGGIEDIIRTRIYVTDIGMWEAVGRAHGEYFRGVKPATSMVQVSSLISEEFLVEIEATAVLRRSSQTPS
jgi:enamine deaminase RidA (YjgF/YER057c/UK114 family)